MHIEPGGKVAGIALGQCRTAAAVRRFQAQRFGFLDAFAEDEENSVIV